MNEAAKIIKIAKACHTKSSWLELFDKCGDTIAKESQPKLVRDLFSMLKNDANYLQYPAKITGVLLRGCLASWDLELGEEIYNINSNSTSAEILLPGAEILLHKGQTPVARKLISRSLRLSSIDDISKLKFQVLLCTSYAEEGKRTKTIPMLRKLEEQVDATDLSNKDLVAIKTQLARLQFFLGRYLEAANLFEKTVQAYLDMEDWDGATKSLFNTAACTLNDSSNESEKGFLFIEEARRLAERHSLVGPLAHCESFYGLDAYQHGNFAQASLHFKKALEILPSSDKGYRRLHVLSMLTLTYFASGKFGLANKFGKQTLDLASLDMSNRQSARFISLEARLDWENGLIPQSVAKLSKATEPFFKNGVQTLEELAMFSKKISQEAKLGRTTKLKPPKIATNLQKTNYEWLEYQNALGMEQLIQDNYTDAYKKFEFVFSKARSINDKYHEVRGLLGVIQAALRQGNLTDDIILKKNELEVKIARLGDGPHRSEAIFALAGLAYQTGDFTLAERYIKQANIRKDISYADLFASTSWLATIEGKASKFTTTWQEELVGNMSKQYFRPTLKKIDHTHFLISDRYQVSLEKHPSLADILNHLLSKSNFSATPEEIQTEVWRQSLRLQGWKQKIRNSIKRLRDLFPYTIAPLIIHSDQIRLFTNGISIFTNSPLSLDKEDLILSMLSNEPMSSNQISKRLEMPPTTTKRLLKKLVDDSAISVIKLGRNVFYTSIQ